MSDCRYLWWLPLSVTSWYSDSRYQGLPVSMTACISDCRYQWLQISVTTGICDGLPPVLLVETDIILSLIFDMSDCWYWSLIVIGVQGAYFMKCSIWIHDHKIMYEFMRCSEIILWNHVRIPSHIYGQEFMLKMIHVRTHSLKFITMKNVWIPNYYSSMSA